MGGFFVFPFSIFRDASKARTIRLTECKTRAYKHLVWSIVVSGVIYVSFLLALVIVFEMVAIANHWLIGALQF